MKKTAVLMISLVFALSFPLLAFAQENSRQTAPDDQAAVEQPSPDTGGMMDDEDMPAMGQPMGKGACGKSGECMKHGGAMCGPGCGCESCMMKKGGMDVMHGAGKMGMHGDIDAMTWPPMQKSCKTPDFYLAHSGDLSLSEDQVDSIERIHSALKKEMILKGADVKVRELELSDIVSRADFKLGDAVAKLKEVEDARVTLRSSVLKYSAQARDILTPEQMKGLKALCRTERSGGMRDGRMENNMKRMMMEKMQKERMQQ